MDAVGGGEGVRAGALEDGKDQRFLAAEIGVGAVILSAELDAGDVGDAGLAAAGIGADDDVDELCRISQPALGFDVELEGVAATRGAAGIGRLAEGAG